MSGIAEVLCNLGFSVSGSDARRGKNTDRLETLFDVRIAEGHAAENVGDAQVVVYSSAVKENSPLLSGTTFFSSSGFFAGSIGS